MRSEQIRQIDNNDLKNQLQEQEETLFRLKFQIGMGQTDVVKSTVS